jgi:hypothetical protein
MKMKENHRNVTFMSPLKTDFIENVLSLPLFYKERYCYMFEVSLVVALALLQQCNNTTPAQQMGDSSLLYSLGKTTMSKSVTQQ